MGQESSGTARAEEVEDAVEDFSEVGAAGASSWLGTGMRFPRNWRSSFSDANVRSAT